MATATSRKSEEQITARPDERKPFLEHLEELRRRLLRCFLWAVIGAAVAWGFTPELLRWLIRPAGQVVYLSPVEPFLVHLKVAMFSGLLLSSPLLAWEVWGFACPALGPGACSLVGLLLPISLGLLLVGAWFGWNVLLPGALKVLLSFGAGVMTPMLAVDHYVTFASWLILGCGLVFQVPLLVLFLTRTGIVRPQMLLRHWRFALVLILLAAAVLTPTPDVFTQLLLAAPLLILYTVSVALSFLVRRRSAIPEGAR